MKKLLVAIPLIVTLFGCGEEEKTTLTFIPTWQGQELACGSSLTNELSVSTFQFYLSGLAVNDSHKSVVRFEEGDFATADVALVGMDSAACEQQKWTIELARKLPEFVDKVSFDIAIPFEQNHANPLLQPAPINNSRMFWSWQLGHKFIRLDMESANNDWSFHLGSTGCKAESKVRAPTTTCSQPNVFNVTIPIEQNFDGNIHIDLDALMKDVELENSCISEDDSPVCAQLTSNIENNQQTRIFYVQTP